MEHLANTAGMITDANLDKNVDSQMFRDEGEKRITRIQEKWDQISDVVLLRQS